MNHQWILGKVRDFPERLWMSQGSRGVYTGQVEQAIKTAAGTLSLPVGSGRDIRLRLASEVFGREILTFNELTDAELWALSQYVLAGQAAVELPDWLRQRYGEQEPLL